MHLPQPLPITASLLAAAAIFVTAASGQSRIAVFEDGPNFSDYGSAALNIGDLDGDGYPEIVIGAPRGGAGAPGGFVELRNSRTGDLIWRRLNQAPSAYFGAEIENLGDLNGDGVPDLLVGTPGESALTSSSGAIRVLSGADGALLREWFGTEEFGEFGREVTPIGDVDGDGSPDFAFSSLDAPGGFAGLDGRVRVRSALTGVDLFEFLGPNDFTFFGSAVANVGDIDGDGLQDLCIGNSYSSRAGSQFGTADIYSMATGLVILELDGDETGARFATAAASADDVNLDGVPDIIIGAPEAQFAGLRAGKAVVFSGADGSILVELINRQQLASFANIVGSAGDMDGDGFPELFASSPYPVNSQTRGFVSVYRRDGIRLFRVDGDTGTDRFGLASPAGDIDGDGLTDLFVGAPWYAPASSVQGRLYVYTLDPINGGVLCAGTANSTGTRSQVTAESPSSFTASANDLTLTVSSLPTDVLGYFLVSRGDGIVLFPGTSEGRLCISSTEFGRYSQFILSSGTTGEVALAPNLLSIPLATASGTGTYAGQAGDTFNFQLWHRDRNASGVPTDNFSDAVTVTLR